MSKRMTRRNRYTRKKRKVRKTMSKTRSRTHNARRNRKQHGGAHGKPSDLPPKKGPSPPGSAKPAASGALKCPNCHKYQIVRDTELENYLCDDCGVDDSMYICQCGYGMCEDCYKEGQSK
jgi:hypothetical protein